MKLFTLRTTAEEQKADNSLSIKAMLALFFFLFIGGVVYKLFDAAFGVNTNPDIKERLFFPVLIAYSSLVPSIVRYGWKQLLPRIAIGTFIVATALIGFMRLLP